MRPRETPSTTHFAGDPCILGVSALTQEKNYDSSANNAKKVAPLEFVLDEYDSVQEYVATCMMADTAFGHRRTCYTENMGIQDNDNDVAWVW